MDFYLSMLFLYMFLAYYFVIMSQTSRRFLLRLRDRARHNHLSVTLFFFDFAQNFRHALMPHAPATVSA
jgi:hypothetical protein